jgi:formate dehydrogenase subunit gamma
LPILHALQDYFGYVDLQVVPIIAQALNLSKAEIHGIISFYHDFRDKPAGQRHIKLCRAEACQALGANDLFDHLTTRHGLTLGGTSPDGAVTVDAVYCLGNCALGPAALVDGAPVGRLTEQGLDRLVDGARRP